MGETVGDEDSGRLLGTAVTRLERVFDATAPHLRQVLSAWLERLGPGSTGAAYFEHENRFPMVALPRWFGAAVATGEDPRFDEDLAYSTVAGYLSIRLLDDLIDGGAERLELLPMVVLLHSEFQSPYHRYFEVDHPFWEVFRRQWFGAADFAANHADAGDFERRVERRLGPSLIPVAAVAHRSGTVPRLPPWHQTWRWVAKCEQLFDDITDWRVDAERSAPNLLVSMYQARRLGGESLEVWVLREGLRLGFDLAARWLAVARGAALSCGSASLDRFLTNRERLLRRMHAEVEPGLAAFQRLQAAMLASP